MPITLCSLTSLPRSSSLQILTIPHNPSIAKPTSRLYQSPPLYLSYHLHLLLRHLHAFASSQEIQRFESILHPRSCLQSLYKLILSHHHVFSPSHLTTPRKNFFSLAYFSMGDHLSMAISHMNLGASDPPRMLSAEAQDYSLHLARNSLVVRRLHHTQPADKLRNLLVDLWKLPDRSSALVQDDGTILVTFPNEVRLLDVLENEPWHYNGWALAVDLWSNRFKENFLQEYFVWVRVLNVPSGFRNHKALMDIAKSVGKPDDSKLRQAPWNKSTDCLVRVRKNIGDKLKFAQRHYFPGLAQPVLLHFVYERLRNFCTYCGSILHHVEECALHAEALRQQRRNAPRSPLPPFPGVDFHSHQAEPLGRGINSQGPNLPGILPTPMFPPSLPVLVPNDILQNVRYAPDPLWDFTTRGDGTTGFQHLAQPIPHQNDNVQDENVQPSAPTLQRNNHQQPALNPAFRVIAPSPNSSSSSSDIQILLENDFPNLPEIPLPPLRIPPPHITPSPPRRSSPVPLEGSRNDTAESGDSSQPIAHPDVSAILTVNQPAVHVPVEEPSTEELSSYLNLSLAPNKKRKVQEASSSSVARYVRRKKDESAINKGKGVVVSPRPPNAP